MKLTLTLFLIIISAPIYAARGLPDDCPTQKTQRPIREHIGRPIPWLISLDPDTFHNNEFKTTPTGIIIDTSWKNAVYDFALKNVQHPSWGINHSERNYQLTKILAEKEKVEIDTDILFAASFLHDLGGLKNFEILGVDHAVRSAELAEKLLKDAGFPMEKWPVVKEIILGHTYYTGIPTNKVAQLFRDADVLDFLGTIGVARILAITQEEGTSDSTLKPTIDILKSFSKSMGSKCISEACKEMAKPRQLELVKFLQLLSKETFEGKAL